ncbi:LytR/AlgR family response regulator transcription factor [Haliscomenobacter hydrossis]|uniref:Two component transcriptional regulator, LytTR family n=1 Tax=Haliscomenobacter hydrossis (strain ATCC 27775 / DSM 1100 / LMG 10767 / O) TaxID=760192 RepID=F4L2W0_HALH1|nr:LytTR family DNA-binding domain-containing protein [Haliscomenobacter hydrossis]AEE49640.1 two component transcriptional regulator, LytTR family [Haliscomenobacter hydrossis DSM 1100]
MITCLIVEDEPLAAELLKSYIEKLPDLSLVGHCDSSLEAFSLLQQQHIQLIFLDIQMPRLTGLELLSALKNPPAVVLTTAFREYAVESYDYDVLDYLVKPIQFDRFLKAVGRYYQRQSAQQVPTQTSPDAFEQAYLFFRVDREQQKVWLKDIQYIEGLGDYVKIFTEAGPIITYERLSYLEEKLPVEHFIRIHKSYIICLDKMQSFSGTEVKIVGKRLPVGRMYKDRLGKIG